MNLEKDQAIPSINGRFPVSIQNQAKRELFEELSEAEKAELEERKKNGGFPGQFDR